MDHILSEYGTLFTKPVSSSTGQIVRMYAKPDNAANTFITDSLDSSLFTTSTITLNEIADMIPFKEVIMKIDIEAHECFALQAADELFDKFIIYEVFMELSSAPKHCMDFMLNFFAERNYVAQLIAAHVVNGNLYGNETPSELVNKLGLFDIVWRLQKTVT